MNQFKFLTIDSFEYQLKTYELVSTSIQNDIAHLESSKAINKLTSDEANLLKLYQQNWDILIESTFLQLYAKLEEALYHECARQLIKKKASISRFETPLSEQGYSLSNEHWKVLINISKIRNCLLHGNGRIDSDQYGLDTKETMNRINLDANTALIEIIDLSTHRENTSKIKIKAPFLQYCVEKIKDFIEDQKTLI